jgi:SPP1 gp7 family putative phage head morphogenesis protein
MPNPDDWRPVRRNTTRYAVDLEDWLNEFLPRRLSSFVAVPEDPILWETAEQIARRMVQSVARTNTLSWLSRVSRGTSAWQAHRIYVALRTELLQSSVSLRIRELITANTKLIVAMPDLLAQQTSIFVARQQQKGLRAEAIAADLRKRLPLLRKSSVAMLARTSVARAETALTQARSEQLGLGWYEWATSEDQRVRPSHKLINSTLIAWADPAAPERLAGITSSAGHYAPGQTYNCRCLALPLVDLNEVSWPHKVYSHGTVERMNRRDFAQLLGLPRAA